MNPEISFDIHPEGIGDVPLMKEGAFSSDKKKGGRPKWTKEQWIASLAPGKRKGGNKWLIER